MCPGPSLQGHKGGEGRLPDHRKRIYGSIPPICLLLAAACHPPARNGLVAVRWPLTCGCASSARTDALVRRNRDTFRLLLGFAAARTGKQPSALSLADLDAPLITAFLEHLQAGRGNTARTRNARLAAIHSMFAYAALRCPEHGALIQRVLAIPGKRYDRTVLTYLTEPEAGALLAACDQRTRTGRRDHAMLALAVPAGLRVSALTGLTCADVRLKTGPHVHCTGKGRKERDTPLLPATTRILRAWLAERGGQPGDPLFPGPSGQRLSRDAVERRVALWLGHESITSTQAYLHADMTQKEQAIARTTPPGTKPGRYKPPDPLLAFLENL